MLNIKFFNSLEISSRCFTLSGYFIYYRSLKLTLKKKKLYLIEIILKRFKRKYITLGFLKGTRDHKSMVTTNHVL